MIEVRQTIVFSRWLRALGDRQAMARILVRVERMRLGNPGDTKSVGGGVSELRIAYGPGYRVYFTRRGQRLVVLLCGGSKTTQQMDITKAKQLAKEERDGS